MVERASRGTFVEVGCWLGRSTSFLATEILRSRKEISLFCIDTWEGSMEPAHQESTFVRERTLYETFIKNMAPVAKVITPLRMRSTEAAAHFEDSSVEFVFIDASHDFDSVSADIEAWFPKVRTGGVIGGHDYPGWPGVRNAVDQWSEQFGKKIYAREKSWIHYVSDEPEEMNTGSPIVRSTGGNGSNLRT